VYGIGTDNWFAPIGIMTDTITVSKPAKNQLLLTFTNVRKAILF